MIDLFYAFLKSVSLLLLQLLSLLSVLCLLCKGFVKILLFILKHTEQNNKTE